MSEVADRLNLGFSFVSAGPNKVDGKTPFKYVVTLSIGTLTFSTDYGMGAGRVSFGNREIDFYEMQELKRKGYYKFTPTPPKLFGVLESLQCDCRCIADAPLWDDFASNLGLNVDSIKEKKIYDKCVEIHLQLRKFFGKEFPNFLAAECYEA